MLALGLGVTSSLTSVEALARGGFSANGVLPRLALDFDNNSYVLDTGASSHAAAFTGSSPKLTYSTTSNSTMVNSSGEVVLAPHNLAEYSEDLSQYSTGASSNGTRVNGSLSVSSSEGYVYIQDTISTPAASLHNIEIDVTCDTAVDNVPLRVGLGSARDTALVSFTAGETKRVSFSLTPTSGALLIGLDARNSIVPGGSNETGYTITLDKIAIYRSDLGMAQVPGAATGLEDYVATSGAAKFLPRVGHHIHNGSSFVNEGLLIESEARTNLLLNSATLSTQSVTVAATAHTLSFTGTGTVTLSGVSTAGPLAGTGTGENNRVTLTFTPTSGSLTLTVSGTVSNAQLEAGPTASSYIPTTGATATRAAQSLSVPAHWYDTVNPTPTGSEEVTNGTFDTDLSDWVNSSTGSSTFVFNNGTAELFKSVGDTAAAYQSLSLVEGAVYQLTWEDSGTGGNVRVGTTVNAQNIVAITTDKSVVFVAGSSNFLQFNCGTNNATAILDNISVRKVSASQFGWNNSAVSIQMEGRITFADEDEFTAHQFVRWREDTNNFIAIQLGTNTGNGGRYLVQQRDGGTNDSVASGIVFTTGANVSFNIASRHGSTFVNGAVSGTALTADTTPTALPDLSGTDLEIAFDFMGTIRQFVQYDADIGDTGLEEATS